MLSLSLAEVSMSYPGLAAPVLTVDKLTVRAGQQLAITGASGSGKSTFVNLITGLERASGGEIRWSNVDIAKLSESRRDRWRGANVGLVMQEFHLFPGLTALDNILLPARLAGAMTSELRSRAHELLERTGLSRPGQRVETMSRGEMQRVAVARALLRRPGVIVADEPTASLDTESGEAVGKLLIELAQQENSTLIVVSHDARMIERLPRHIVLSMGRVTGDVDALESAA
jgi:putative ABC transport system ATP-binding protein